MIGSPQVLPYSISSSYIKAIRSLPWKLKMAFGWQNETSESLRFVFSDSLAIQTFQFPNERTVVCFAKYSYAGAVVFKTGTDTIIRVHSWSERVKETLGNGFESEFSFYNYGYTFEEHKTFWKLYLYTLVMVDNEFQVWHFYLDPIDGQSGNGRTDILVEKPSKPKNK
ncbi:MAG: hypothetical protein ABSC53_08190, partial [Bacteroidota bacterium]